MTISPAPQAPRAGSSPRAGAARWRRLHRWVVAIAALPLLLTTITGSLYSVLLERRIDAFWLLELHTGRFGPLNLQPHYSALLGVLCLVATGSGLTLLIRRPGGRGTQAEGKAG